MSHLATHAVEIARVVFYFFCCLVVLQTFRCATLMVVNNKNDFLTSYATAALTALVLGKSVFLLERVRITRIFDTKPVAIVVVYKTILFSLFTDLILSIEHLVKHHSFKLFDIQGDSIQYLVCFGAHQLALFIAFGLFFATRELDLELGGGTISRAFFGKRGQVAKKVDAVSGNENACITHNDVIG